MNVGKNVAQPRSITPGLVRDALYCIPPDIDRETWVRLAMAIKAELGAEGFEIWDAWSQPAADYSAAAARDTWRSIKPNGGITVGTLFGLAKEYGFQFPDGGQVAAQANPEALAEAERLAEEKRRQREAEAQEYRRCAQQAAEEAEKLWAAALHEGDSPYLERKRVPALGVRFLADGTLLVPMRNAAGALQNLQRIAPAKPTPEQEARGFREKRFLPRGRKSGLLHWLGDPSSAVVLCLAEGYATAASVHEATGRPVACCFDAGNLVVVAKELCLLFPGAAFLVCSDDDTATAERTGKNPGRLAAAQVLRAMKAAGAVAGEVFPDRGFNDFNDLHAAAGVAAVAARVEAGIGNLAALADSKPSLGKEAGDPRPEPADEPAPPGNAAKSGMTISPEQADPFKITEAGVFHVSFDQKGVAQKPMWICSPLAVTAKTRSDVGEHWGSLLEFKDLDGNAKTWAMPAALLAGEGSEWAAYLRATGLQIAPGTKARNLLAQYIDTRRTEKRAICTDRVGWHGGTYVLPSGSIGGMADTRFVFQSEGAINDQYKQRGNLTAWVRDVAALAAGNSRVQFALCCAFAGPLLRLAGMESGGFHLRGASSGGKSTAQYAAASVFGPPSYLLTWRTTDNALESVAVQHCDSILILDEFGQLDPKVAGEVCYLLANEQEKGRATRGGLAKPRRTWRLLFLSSGELGLAESMRLAGKEVKAGQEVRFVDIPGDAGAGMGGFERLHNFATPRELAEVIKHRAAQTYGTAGRAWIQWLADNFETLPAELAGLIADQKAAIVPADASQQVFRVGNRFSILAVAGELATKAGLTGWADGDATAAVKKCFAAWLNARGHSGDAEPVAMIRQVRAWLEKNGDALMTWTHRAMDDHRGNTPLRAGFKRLVDEKSGVPLKVDAATDYLERHSSPETSERQNALIEYLVLPEAFRQDLCKGVDSETVAKLLKRRGHLIYEAGRLLDQQRLPGMGKVRCYRIKASIFDDDGVTLPPAN